MENNQEIKFVRIEETQLNELLRQNKEMKADIATFIKDGPMAIFSFLGNTNRAIPALGKATAEMIKNPEKFKKTGEVAGIFLAKYEYLTKEKEPLKISENDGK